MQEPPEPQGGSSRCLWAELQVPLVLLLFYSESGAAAHTDSLKVVSCVIAVSAHNPDRGLYIYVNQNQYHRESGTPS